VAERGATKSQIEIFLETFHVSVVSFFFTSSLFLTEKVLEKVELFFEK